MARRHLGLLVASLMLAVGGAPALPAHAADLGGSATDPYQGQGFVDPAYSGATTVGVRGRLLVAVHDGSPSEYAVALDDGAVVPVEARGGLTHVEPNAAIEARLVVPAAVRDQLAVPSGTTLNGRSGRRAVSLISARTSPAAVASASWSALPQAAPAATGVRHHVYVALPNGLGNLKDNLTDDQALAELRTAADYWVSESNGRIAGFDIETSIKRYNPTAATATDKCGLDSDFFDVSQELENQFPGIDFGVDSGNMAVLLAPTGCASTSAAGTATVGASLASGGPSVLTLDSTPSALNTVAHEWGHTFGLAHSNLGRCGGSPYTCQGEYDDLYNVMDRSVHTSDDTRTATGTAYRSILGILDPGEVQDDPIPAGTSAVSNTFTLQAQASSTGLRSVKVVDPDTGEPLFVEYRDGSGRDAGTSYTAGLTVEGLTFRSGVVLEGVDGTSAYLASDDSSDPGGIGKQTAFLAGQDWQNGSGTLKVHVAAIASGTATVTVTYPAASTFGTTPAWSIHWVDDPDLGQVLRPVATTTPQPTPTSYRYQWLRNGLPIAGAVEDHLAPDLDGSSISVRIGSYRAGLRPATSDSTSLVVGSSGGGTGGGTTGTSGPVVSFPSLLTLQVGHPAVTGRPRVGRRLTARPGGWTPGTSFAYAWLANGRRIRGHSGPTLKLTNVLRGKRISVRVTGNRAGYATSSAVSAATAKVKR